MTEESEGSDFYAYSDSLTYDEDDTDELEFEDAMPKLSSSKGKSSSLKKKKGRVGKKKKITARGAVNKYCQEIKKQLSVRQQSELIGKLFQATQKKKK